MKSIGLRELRQRASHYLHHVEVGRAIEITMRGRPVALLVPLRGLAMPSAWCTAAA
jgi:prevent-host-death family protein